MIEEVSYAQKSKVAQAAGRFFVCRYASHPFEVQFGNKAPRIPVDSGDAIEVPNGFESIKFFNRSNAEDQETLVVSFYAGPYKLSPGDISDSRTRVLSQFIEVDAGGGDQTFEFPGTLTAAQAIALNSNLGPMVRKQFIVRNLHETSDVILTGFTTVTGLTIRAGDPPLTLLTNETLTVSHNGVDAENDIPVEVMEVFYPLI